MINGCDVASSAMWQRDAGRAVPHLYRVGARLAGARPGLAAEGGATCAPWPVALLRPRLGVPNAEWRAWRGARSCGRSRWGTFGAAPAGRPPALLMPAGGRRAVQREAARVRRARRCGGGKGGLRTMAERGSSKRCRIPGMVEVAGPAEARLQARGCSRGTWSPSRTGSCLPWSHQRGSRRRGHTHCRG